MQAEDTFETDYVFVNQNSRYIDTDEGAERIAAVMIIRKDDREISRDEFVPQGAWVSASEGFEAAINARKNV